jgi:hypothetical protein
MLARPACVPNRSHQEQMEVIVRKNAQAVWSEATKLKSDTAFTLSFPPRESMRIGRRGAVE